MDRNINMPFWESVETMIFDFDGIFTNNKVMVSEDGKEYVICDRADGLAFDLLRKFKKLKQWNLDYFILSSETNIVVRSRAEKLKVKSYQAIDSKKDFILNYFVKNLDDLTDVDQKVKNKLDKTIYFGNDLNDYAAMKLCRYSISPSDAHPLIKKIATNVLDAKGGEGFVRAALECILLEGSTEVNALTTLL